MARSRAADAVISFNCLPLLYMDESWWQTEWIRGHQNLLEDARKNRKASFAFSRMLLRQYHLDNTFFFSLPGQIRFFIKHSGSALQKAVFYAGLLKLSASISRIIGGAVLKKISNQLTVEDYFFMLRKGRLFMDFLKKGKESSAEMDVKINLDLVEQLETQIVQAGVSAFCQSVPFVPLECEQRLRFFFPKAWTEYWCPPPKASKGCPRHLRLMKFSLLEGRS